jgi:hypothetical protein
MVYNFSTESEEPDGAGPRLMEAPAAALSVRISSGLRWAAISWQAPVAADDQPIEDYLLAIFPGNTTFVIGAATTRALLIALAPNRPYTFFVAARNAAGTSDWMPSSPLQLSYDAAPPATLPPDILRFDDLLTLDDATLASLLAAQDDTDLVLALSRTSEEAKTRILGELLEPARAERLERRLTPRAEVDGTALARRAARMKVIPPKPEPEQAPPPPEIVVEVVPQRRRSNLRWLAILAPLLLLVFYLVWDLSASQPPQANARLESTVEALVALQMTAESAVIAPPAPEATLNPATTVDDLAHLSTLAPPTTASDSTVAAVYAEPAVELLNVRSGPGESYEIVEIVSAGERLQVTERSDDGNWFRVATSRGEGWAASRFLAMEVNPRTQTVLVTLLETPSETPPLSTAIPTLPPPTPTSAEPTPLLPAVVAEPQPTETPLPPQPLTSNALEPAPHPCMVPGYFWLIYPVETTVGNQVTFRWGFSGVVPDECGFEVRVWRPGEPPSGVHDAVADHRNGVVKLTRANEYRLDIPLLGNLPAVSGTSGDYYWSVSLIQVSPSYHNFGRQADPSYFYVQLH